MSYPLKFRLHILKVRRQEGLTYEETAKRFQVGIASVVRWDKCPNPAKGRNREPTKISMEALAEDIKLNPDAPLHERAKRFGLSISGIYHALKRLGVTYKKRHWLILKQMQLLDLTLKRE